jgi:hypothetical protein
LDELILVFKIEEEGVSDEVELLVLVDVDLDLFDGLEEVSQKTTIELLKWNSRFAPVADVKHVHEVANSLAFSTDILVASLSLLLFY